MEGEIDLGFLCVEASGFLSSLPFLPLQKLSCRSSSSSLENAALSILLGKCASLSTHLGGREIAFFFIFLKSISSPPHLFLGLPAQPPRVEKG